MCCGLSRINGVRAPLRFMAEDDGDGVLDLPSEFGDTERGVEMLLSPLVVAMDGEAGGSGDLVK